MSYRFRNRRSRRPTASPPPPGPDTRPARRRPGPRTVLCQLLICLTVTLGLSSAHLEATASSQPFGTERSVTLAVARPLHRLANAAGLDRPDRAVARVLGRDADGAPTAPSPADPGPLEAAAGEDASAAVDDVAVPSVESGGPASPPDADTTGDGSDGALVPTPVLYGPPHPGVTTGVDGSAPLDPTGATGTTASPGDLAATGAQGVAAPAGPEAALSMLPAPGLGPAVIDPPTGADSLPEPGPARPVTPESRLRLWAGGDSLGEYVGNQLLAPLSDRKLTAVDLDFHIGTGLTRPDTYDWEARIDEVMARPEPPEALVFMVGGNDNQPMRAGGQNLDVGSEPWLAEYRARVADLMDSTRPPDDRPGSAHLWWIGLPPMRDGERDGLARAIDAIVAEEASGRSWVTFVDLMPRFSGPDGGFAGSVTGPDGKAKVARAPDGIHITYAGSTWIAEDIWADIVSRWALR